MDLVSLAAACVLQTTVPTILADPHCNGSQAQAAPAAHQPAHSDTPLQPWESFVGEAARRFDVPPDWIRRVIKVESGGNTTLHGRPITSVAGAMGLMQLMPGTYADMRRAYHLGGDPFDPHDNILAGTAYLRAMFDRFGSGVFAAYNAGPQHYEAYLEGRRALPSETVSYLAKLNVPAAVPTTKVTASVFAVPASELFFALSNQHASASVLDIRAMASTGQPKASPHSRKNNLFFPLSTGRP